MPAMISTSISQVDLIPEPDLYPLYPTTAYVQSLLSSHSGLAPVQKAQLVSHCLTRSCVFGDLTILQFLLADPQAQVYIDLGMRDEDGLCLVSLAIQGFGAESDRDVEREECVRLLVSQGAYMGPDNAGWTPLHHAALLSPPTLVSYLMTHGCSPFSLTRRNLTPLDIVTAHSVIPGRDDVALLLEESMRGEGWTGGKMEQKRRLLEARLKRRGKRKVICENITRVLELEPRWWGTDSELAPSESSDSEDEDDCAGELFTPSLDYTTMLVFSPDTLPNIFDSLIVRYPPYFRDITPASTLYMLTRFACLTCDQDWLEELVDGATHEIEDLLFRHPDSITSLVFWLHNVTIWLHLVQCDHAINNTCEMVGTIDLLEDLINTAYVHIIRYVEKRIDQMFDAALLDFSPRTSDLDSVQFESDWSFFRQFTVKKKTTPQHAHSNSNGTVSPPSSPGRPHSPPPQNQATISQSKSFSSLRKTFARTRASSSATPLSSIFSEIPPPTPHDLTVFLTAVHSLLALSNVNPSLIVQIWSQVMYWTSSELFNRIMGRKKYLCRSRAVQIGLNVSMLEDWIDEMGLPPGVQSHLTPVRHLLTWLQNLSSITDFANLVATIQVMKSLNPLQMRRAVREYKYEVNEGRMTEECIQYLTQIQKDWERHRVKLGVEAIKKEFNDRDRESVASANDTISINSSSNASATSEISNPAQNIDVLFDRHQNKQFWEPLRPPPLLGEFFNSRYMLPLQFPSNPRMLAARPGKASIPGEEEQLSGPSDSRSPSRSSDQAFSWRLNCRKLCEVELRSLQRLDGVRRTAQWGRSFGYEEDGEQQERVPESNSDDEVADSGVNTRFTPLARKPSVKVRGKHNDGETPVEQR
ncbi:DIL domain containing protein [Amanita muscaria]